MKLVAPAQPDTPPALLRLESICPLDHAAKRALVQAMQQTRSIRSHRELLREGVPIDETLLILGGWAARVRQFEDGRRQIMSFVLPGDLIGNCRQSQPVAVSSVIALTALQYCAAPAAEASQSLSEAYSASHAMEEAYLLAQITRLGRMSAEERFADLMLELLERLALCGVADGNGFPFPLTQETLADATGLSCVHINRTIQTLRRQGDVVFRSGYLTLPNPAQLAKRVGRSRFRVSVLPGHLST